jgi:hypothetical protein
VLTAEVQMYTLPSKFTGTNAKSIEFGEFKTLCYSLQGLGVLNVIDTEGYNYPNNYYSATVTDDYDEFSIYLNCFVPVIGIGRITDEKEEFFYKPEIMSAINDYTDNYIILTPETLLENVNNDTLRELSKIERKEVSWWLPATVGRLLFCGWFD